MITLTLNVANPAQVIASGYPNLVVAKSSTQTSAGPWGTLVPAIALISTQTLYSFTDVAGSYGDWYVTQFETSGGILSSNSTPQPGYFSDLANTIRDLLGVTTNEVTDSQIQGFSYLPTALARIHGRFVTFDTSIASGGDTSSLCLGALAHLTAALLCPRMTVAVVDSEQFKDYRYQRNRQMDWNQTQQELLVQYEMLISQAAGEVTSLAATFVSGLVLAGPSRSGNDNDGGLVPFTPDPLENPLLPYNPTINP